VEAANIVCDDVFELKGKGVDDVAKRVAYLLEKDRYACPPELYDVRTASYFMGRVC
jgi:hypothetical protein